MVGMSTNDIRQSNLRNDENLEDFSLIWLDSNINKTADCSEMINTLHSIINNLKTFDNIDECIDYINSVAINERFFLIVSGQFGEKILPNIYQSSKIISIYIFCYDKIKHEKWSNQYKPKIQGVFDEKHSLYSKLISDIKLQLQNFPPINDCKFATMFYNIGKLLYEQGHLTEALDNLEKALEIQLQCTHLQPNDLAVTYNNLAGVYLKQQNYEQALFHANQTLKYSPKSHKLLVASYDIIAELHFKQNQFKEALNAYSKKIDIMKEMPYEDHLELAKTYNNIGMIHYHLSNYDLALAHFQQTLDIDDEVLESNHPNLAITYNNIAEIYDIKEYYNKALENYHKELHIRLKSLGSDYSDLILNYRNLSIMYYKLSNYTDALKMNEMALKTASDYLSIDDEQFITLYNDLGAMYDTNKDYDNALKSYEKALEIGLRILPIDSIELVELYEHLDQIYYNKNNLIDIVPPTNDRTSLTHNAIGNIYNKMTNYEKALVFYENAYQTELKMLSPNYSYIEIYRNNIKQTKKKLSKFTVEKFLEFLSISCEVLFNSG
jgi:tetratricopeptide (TPR) repeat protein